MSLTPEQRQIEKHIREAAPTLLHSLPGDKKKQLIEFLQTQPTAAEAAMSVVQSVTTSSPVPPAELLAGYNREIPDGANRLFVLVEKQSEHRQQIEKAVIGTQTKTTKRGQWIALGLVIMLSGIGSYFGYQRQDVLAGTIFATTILGVATVFIAGRTAQQRNLDRKAPR